MANVYVKTDSKSVITEINSDIFLHTVEKYTLIGEGVGDKYAHAQGNYLEHGLMDDSGRYNYKLLDGNVVELTEAEKRNCFQSLSLNHLTQRFWVKWPQMPKLSVWS